MSDVQENQTQAAPVAYANFGENNNPVLVEHVVKFKRPSTKSVEKAKAENSPVPQERKPITLSVPQYTAEQIQVLFAANTKVADFIRDSVNAAIEQHARNQTQQDENPVNADADLDRSKLDLVFIASLTKADRATAPEKEAFEAFALAFKSEIQLYIPGMNAETAAIVANTFQKKYTADARANLVIMEKLQKMLHTFAAKSPASPDHQDVIEWLDARADAIINRDDSNTLAGLLG